MINVGHLDAEKIPEVVLHNIFRIAFTAFLLSYIDQACSENAHSHVVGIYSALKKKAYKSK